MYETQMFLLKIAILLNGTGQEPVKKECVNFLYVEKKKSRTFMRKNVITTLYEATISKTPAPK